MMTFREAYRIFGRDSMAIAEAIGVEEAVAYNLIARHTAFPHPSLNHFPVFMPAMKPKLLIRYAGWEPTGAET